MRFYIFKFLVLYLVINGPRRDLSFSLLSDKEYIRSGASVEDQLHNKCHIYDAQGKMVTDDNLLSISDLMLTRGWGK